MSDQYCQVIISGSGKKHTYSFYSFAEALAFYQEVEEKFARHRIRNRGEAVQKKLQWSIMRISFDSRHLKSPKLMLTPEEWFDFSIGQEMIDFADEHYRPKNAVP